MTNNLYISSIKVSFIRTEPTKMNVHYTVHFNSHLFFSFFLITNNVSRRYKIKYDKNRAFLNTVVLVKQKISNYFKNNYNLGIKYHA